MPHHIQGKDDLDTALTSLSFYLRLQGIPADPEHLRHEFAPDGNPMDADTLCRAAAHLGIKARKHQAHIDDLNKLPLPALALHNDGHWFLLAACRDAQVLIQDPLEQRPLSLPVEVFSPGWSRHLILLKHQGKTDRKTRFGIRWFIPALIKYRHLFVEVFVASFFIQSLALVTPLFFQVVIDKVLVHKGLTTLDVLAIGLLLVSLFEVLLGGLRTYLFSHTANRIDVELGARLFRHLLKLPMAYFHARRVGDSVARVRELERIREFLTGSSLTLVLDIFFTFVFFAVMFLYSKILTLVVLLSIPAYLLLSIFITPILRSRLDEKFRRGAENQAFLVESVNGIETIKTMAVEPQMQKRWEEQLAHYVKSSFSASHLGNLAGQSASFINKFTTLLLLWIGAHLVIEGKLSVGQLVAFNMLAGQVSGPILRLVQLWQDFQQARISIDRLGDILNNPAEPVPAKRSRLPALQGTINFEHISFRYQPDRPAVLQDINLHIKAGEFIGIVGRSGSGKSTLTKLIQHLYTPESGRILVDGTNLHLVDTTWLRRQIGVVLQENQLFNRSIRENIALADPGSSMEKVVAAAKLAGAHEFIIELPEAYDTEVGEHGATLSGGQRQRIAIARALLTNPRILIFDEATSALDYESERIIQDNMAAIRKGRTVIVIAHRLSAVKQADRIIGMEHGRIVEAGTHRELINCGGLYAHLYSLQNDEPLGAVQS